MRSKLRASGLFFGVIFFAGALLNFLDGMLRDKLPLLAALTEFNYVLSLVIISAFMFASAYVSWLAWFQPVLFLILTPIPALADSASFFGLGFFAVGLLLLFKTGFFDKYRIPKAICAVAYILAIEVIGALRKGQDIYQGLTPTFFILAFIAFLFITFRDRIVVYLKEPKAKLSLEAKGLADAEQHYVRALISGKTVKETSFEFGVSESTVRNTLSRAYKKLGVTGKADMATLAEKYEIVE
jgi:DNA-binding CsgD family transcriptional regulator